MVNPHYGPLNPRLRVVEDLVGVVPGTALLVPQMTTTQRDALVPVNGMVIYNTTLGSLQAYQSGVWVTLAVAGVLLAPQMTTVQRDALAPVNGMIIYNTTLVSMQAYENGAWVNMIGWN